MKTYRDCTEQHKSNKRGLKIKPCCHLKNNCFPSSRICAAIHPLVIALVFSSVLQLSCASPPPTTSITTRINLQHDAGHGQHASRHNIEISALSLQQQQQVDRDREEDRSPIHSHKPPRRNNAGHGRNLFLESFFRTKNYADDIMDTDADADDDDDIPAMNNKQKQQHEHAVMTSSSDIIDGNATMDDNSRNTHEFLHIHPWGNYTKCKWYTLSHYISPESIVYDGIEGFLIALLVCLVIATVYNYSYYCCLTKIGCCPDDRIKKSLLSKRGRRRMRRKRGTEAVGWGCCGCTCFRFGARKVRSADGKGTFMPISTYNDDSSDDDDDSEHSSVSLDSALSLEYGDDHLHNEFGEVTSRWDDAKIEAAAREYFSKEEKEAQETSRQKERKKRGGVSFKSPKRRSDKIVKSGRTSNRNRRGENIAKSQASSILSSSSEHSFVSYASSSSGSHDGLEMEAAMMDLELVKRSIAEKGYV
jgi:hypothetical protein